MLVSYQAGIFFLHLRGKGKIMYDKDRDFLNKNFYYLQIMFSSFPEADCARSNAGFHKKENRDKRRETVF